MTGKLTFKTYQRGVLGAIGVVFRDGVMVWETRLLQSPRGQHDDRKLAALACVERIFDMRTLERKV
jgi:hypothetical protein